MFRSSLALRAAAPALLLALGGCASAAYSLVTAPISVARTGVNTVGKTYDALTTSQSESDEKRGRSLRKNEKRLEKLQKAYREEAEDCDDGDDDACRKLDDIRDEMDDLRQRIPAVRY